MGVGVQGRHRGWDLVLEGGGGLEEAVGLAGEGVTYVGSPRDPTRQTAGRESRRC